MCVYVCVQLETAEEKKRQTEADRKMVEYESKLRVEKERADKELVCVCVCV